MIEISLNPFRSFTKTEKKALEKEALRYGKFVGKQAVIDFNPGAAATAATRQLKAEKDQYLTPGLYLT